MTPEHEQLLLEMSQHLLSCGYNIISAAYADICDEATKNRLASIYSVPATYVRTRADRIAFNAQSGVCFEFDAKTNLTRYDDVFVELLPVVAHYAIHKWFGLKTIYGFRWPHLDRIDIGFMIDDRFAELVTAIFLFDRDCQAEVNQWVQKIAPHIFTNATIIRTDRGGGSGDPAIKITGDKLDSLPHWQDLIR